MKFYIKSCCLGILAAGVFAGPLMPSALYAAGDDKVVVDVSKKVCRRLVAHRPSADAAYKAGVDARGRKVAPADLAGTQVIKGPRKISISITKDVLAAYGASSGSSLLESEAAIGTVTYDINSGKMEFNGQFLTDPEIAALSDACKKAK